MAFIFIPHQSSKVQSWISVGLVEPEGTPENTSEQYSKAGESLVYLVDSFFDNIISGTNGGAICISSTTDSSQMLIEVCIFNDCHTNSEYGGAIFMGYPVTSSNGAGSCVVHKCCSNNCSSTSTRYSYGHFIYTMLSNDNDHINKFLDSSVINSKQINFESEGTIELLYGEITINTLNLSENQCVVCPAIWCYQGSSNTKLICSIKFCSIRNNVGLVSTLAISTTFASCTNSNFIENTASYYGLIQAHTEMIVEGCTILENKAASTFYCNTGPITVINCTITEEDVIKTNANVNIENWTPNPNSFVNGIFPTFLTKLCVEYSLYSHKFGGHGSWYHVINNFIRIVLVSFMLWLQSPH